MPFPFLTVHLHDTINISSPYLQMRLRLSFFLSLSLSFERKKHTQTPTQWKRLYCHLSMVGIALKGFLFSMRKKWIIFFFSFRSDFFFCCWFAAHKLDSLHFHSAISTSLLPQTQRPNDYGCVGKWMKGKWNVMPIHRTCVGLFVCVYLWKKRFGAIDVSSWCWQRKKKYCTQPNVL